MNKNFILKKNLIMELLNKIKEIISKYDLKPIDISKKYKNIYQYLNDHPEDTNKYQSDKNDKYFTEKYYNYISNGHYGFSIGNPIIPEWNEIIDNIIQLCIENDPKFEIFQIKIKFGGICFYVHSDIISDLLDIIIFIENKLRDKALIY